MTTPNGGSWLSLIIQEDFPEEVKVKLRPEVFHRRGAREPTQPWKEVWSSQRVTTRQAAGAESEGWGVTQGEAGEVRRA